MKTRKLFLKNALLFSLFLIFSCSSENSNKDLIKNDGINRSLSLLHNSTIDKPYELEIFFYGQSIVGGMNSKRLVDSLQKIFPYTNLTHDNKAIGGFQIPSLIKTANHDVYHENPDLIIFHAYSGIKDGLFDSLIQTIRRRLSSDIILFDHHYVWDTSGSKLDSKNTIDSLESIAIKEIAKKYNCAYINVREQWAQYLNENNLGANVLIGNTIDSEVHPNEEGKKLLRNIILSSILEKEYKKYDPNQDKLRQSILIKNKRKFYKKKFTGNRVDLISDTIVDPETEIQVLIDGKPPSAFRNSYYISRPSIGYNSWMPMIKKVSFGKKFPRSEEWLLTINEVDRENRKFKYKLEGSITGFDGEGNSESDFVSNSNRISIDKEDFYLFDIERIIGLDTPKNYQVNFKVIQTAKDTIQLSSKKTKYQLFSDINSEEHTLKLKFLKGNTKLKKLIIYKPYLEKDE